MPIFKLELQPTYFKQGFFNVVIDYDRYVRKSDGPARVLGGPCLRAWFQQNFKPMDTVAVDLTSEEVIVLDRK